MATGYRTEEGPWNPAARDQPGGGGAGAALRPWVALSILIPVLLSVLLRLPFLGAPLERDEGEYAYIAWRMSAGEVPYLHTFDQKPPGVFLVYWLSFAVLGRNLEAVRLMLILWGAAATAILAWLGRRYAGPRAGLAAGVAFALVTTSPSFWATAANTELFMLLPLVAALALAFPGPGEGLTRRQGRLLTVGALLAVAFLFKQVAAFFALALLPFLLLERAPEAAAGPPRWRLRWAPLALVVAGGLAVLVPVVLLFAAAGAYREFLDAVLLHNLAYVGSECQSWSLPFLRFVLARIAAAHWPVLLLGALGLVGIAATWRERPPVWRFIFLWLPAALASAVLGCRFFPHYFLAAAPPLALAAGLGVERLAAALERKAAGPGGEPGSRRAGRLVSALALVAILAVPLGRESELIFAMSPGARSHAIYGPEIFPGSQTLGEYVRARTRPEDAVFVLGSEPQVLFHAERRSATRYIFFDPLLGSFPDALARQREAIAEVRAAQPAAVVFVRHPNSLGAPPDDESLLIRSTRDLLAREYSLEGALFLVPDGALPVLGPQQIATLPPSALRRATVLLYFRSWAANRR